MTSESPYAWLSVGLGVSVLAGILWWVATTSTPQEDGLALLGAMILAIGGLLIQVVVIALGVSMGMYHHDRVRTRGR
jgi:hypothetical protein